TSHQLVTAGKVRFSVVSADPFGLGVARFDRRGEASISTSKLKQQGSYEIQAEFIPTTRRYGPSFGRITVVIGPPQVTSFRISAAHYYGAPGTPLTFTVTAFDRQKQPVTDYTGTINLSSPTDHSAHFSSKVYTFTTADHGTHTFADGITFHKGGAEVLK